MAKKRTVCPIVFMSHAVIQANNSHPSLRLTGESPTVAGDECSGGTCGGSAGGGGSEGGGVYPTAPPMSGPASGSGAEVARAVSVDDKSCIVSLFVRLFVFFVKGECIYVCLKICMYLFVSIAIAHISLMEP